MPLSKSERGGYETILHESNGGNEARPPLSVIVVDENKKDNDTVTMEESLVTPRNSSISQESTFNSNSSLSKLTLSGRSSSNAPEKRSMSTATTTDRSFSKKANSQAMRKTSKQAGRERHDDLAWQRAYETAFIIGT